MTTNELKSYIDRILGNNIRLLLPSYWWKRAFGAVIDKVDEKVEKSDLKTINGESVFGEGDLRVGVKSVDSVEKLEQLEAQVGDIATVGGEALRVISIGSIGAISSIDAIVSEWENLTRIDKVGIISPYNGDKYALMWLHAKSQYGTDMIQLASSNGEIGFGRTYNNEFKEISLEEVNSLLSDKDYRAIRIVGSGLEELVDAIDSTFKLYVNSSSADAYIKSDSWEKLSKEHIVSNEEELNALDVENGTIAKVAKWQYGKIDPYKCVTINDALSDKNSVKENWEKLTRITNVELVYPETPPTNLENSAIVLLHGYATAGYDVIQITYYNGWKIVTGSMSSVNMLSLSELNNVLSQNDYRVIGISSETNNAEFLRTHISLFSPTASLITDAYIKGETWTRLLKEGDVVGGGAEALSIYFPFGEGTQLSAEQKNSNADTYSALQSSNKKSIHFYVFVEAGTMWFPVCHYYQSKRQGEEAYFNIITYDFDDNSPFQKLHFKLYSDGRIEAVEYIKADSELSETSENPVQNKAIKAYVDEKVANVVASSFVIDLTVDEIEDAIANNGGVIGYTLNRELIIDALSKNIPIVVRIGEHSEGYCLAQGELDGADTLTITFNHSQYKYSILIGDESIEVDRSSSISALEARLAELEAKLS